MGGARRRATGFMIGTHDPMPRIRMTLRGAICYASCG